MQKEDIQHLNQLIASLEEALKKIEIYYEKKDFENFDKMKKFILEMFNKISEVAK